MPRPLAFGLLLLVLFLTSRSEWEVSHSRQMEEIATERRNKVRKLEVTRDTMKEKLLLDLTAECKTMEEENKELKKLLESLHQQANSCRLPLQQHPLPFPVKEIMLPAQAYINGPRATPARASTAEDKDVIRFESQTSGSTSSQHWSSRKHRRLQPEISQ